MNFPGFLGNETIKSRLSASARTGTLGHAWILSGPAGSGRHTLARILAAALQCTGEGTIPCMQCDSCRKIFGGGHTDVITVTDSDKVNLSVKTIRTKVVADSFVRPGDGKRKIYILPQPMLPAAQNALLKILEEPPAYCTFIIITESTDQILPTVRSRCSQLQLLPLSDETLRNALREEFPAADEESLISAIQHSGGYLGRARDLMAAPPDDTALNSLCDALVSGDTLAMIRALAPLDSMNRNDFSALLSSLRSSVAEALLPGAIPGGTHTAATAALSDAISPAGLYAIMETLSRAISYLQGNGSVSLCIGFLLSQL